MKRTLYDNSLYLEDIADVAKLKLPWDKLQGKNILLSGATGLIGSFFVDVLLYKINNGELSCTIYVLSRDVKKAKYRFSSYNKASSVVFIEYDANRIYEPLNIVNCPPKMDYILHLASNTHPLQYSKDPIGTISINMFGLFQLLTFAACHNVERFVFASSNEIYGENRGDVELFDEEYCGYINSNTLRAGYPESKRCGEALCQAFMSQKNIDVVIPRFTRTYGPTMRKDDSKAISQFINKAINGEDIILKSQGKQYFSFQYVSDSVSGLLTVLLKGLKGNAYNIAAENSDIRLYELARLIAKQCGKKVVFDLPEQIEAAGYSTATKARLNGGKIKKLGWEPKYSIEAGVERTLQILKDLQLS